MMYVWDIPTKKLLLMLEMKRFQDEESQSIIKEEIEFRENGMSFDEMTNVFKGSQ